MVHWSQTPSGALLSRAISFMFSKIISTAKDGGMKEWIEEHCGIFDGWAMEAEQRLEYSQLFSEFERKMEQVLEEFALSEGRTAADISRSIAEVAEGSDSRAARSVRTLLSGLDYKKVRIRVRGTVARVLCAVCYVIYRILTPPPPPPPARPPPGPRPGGSLGRTGGAGCPRPVAGWVGLYPKPPPPPPPPPPGRSSARSCAAARGIFWPT